MTQREHDDIIRHTIKVMCDIHEIVKLHGTDQMIDNMSFVLTGLDRMLLPDPDVLPISTLPPPKSVTEILTPPNRTEIAAQMMAVLITGGSSISFTTHADNAVKAADVLIKKIEKL